MSETSLVITEEPFESPGATLYRQSVVPAAGARARLGIIHGYGDHAGRFRHFMQWMAERGIACHAFDYRGHGRATGRRGFCDSWAEYLEDLRSFVALPEVQAQPDVPLFLLGHSHGGLILGAAGAEGLENVAGAVFVSPWFGNNVRVPWWKLLLGRVAVRCCPTVLFRSGIRREDLTSDLQMIEADACDPLLLRGSTAQWFLCARAEQPRILAQAPRFGLPLLMLYSEADPVIDHGAAHHFYEAAGSGDKSIEVYLSLKHELLRERDRLRIFNRILGWITDRAG